MIRLLVSGTRHATRAHIGAIGEALQPICRRDLGVLAHGAAPGVDTLAAGLAQTWGWAVKPVSAAWQVCDLTVPADLGGCPDWVHRKKRRDGTEYCPYAGRRRNQALVDLRPRADFVVAFPDQRGDKSGTGDLIRRAKRAGYKPEVHEIEVVIPRG